MKIRKITAISLLVFSSFAANTVAPSKSELEAMYDKAFREFDGGNYEQALKNLDAIDARQPDLAESQNLRGVILMRQKDYEKAEAALQRALAADPKFWNARFNLAEIPFLQKNWPEARKRFQDLLTGNASELQGEATQLIQYKVLITYLMEGKDGMVEAIKGKFELAPETPALQYAVASIALNKKDEKAAKEALAAAEKNFSPQLNKLFAESLYEVGWLEKPNGQSRAALEINSAAERAARTKEFAKAKSDEAEQALQQHDLTAARRLIDEADAADPNQATIVNLRGEIFLEHKDWDQAESEFKKALKLDPKLRDAQYNLAQIPFKKKEYTKARERFEELFSVTSGGDKDRAAQLIKFKVYMTYLLEGKDSRAQKMMEQFQFTGDTPALYYAQAAWEFKHDNPSKGNDWVTSARKIYSSALNGVFSDSFLDLGWLQAPVAEPSPAAVVAEATQPELAPSIEPTPIPSMTLAKNDADKGGDSLTLATQPNPALGMEGTTTSAAEDSLTSTVGGAAASPSVETPVASTASPAAAMPVIANASETENPPKSNEPVPSNQAPTAVASASPATVLAPEKVAEPQPSTGAKLFDWNVLRFVGLLAGILLLAWVVIPQFRRLIARRSVEQTLSSAPAPRLAGDEEAVGWVEQFAAPARLAGGPPQVSLHLRASEPAIRRAAMPLGKNGRVSGSVAPVETTVPPEAFVPAASESLTEDISEPLLQEPGEPNEFLPEVDVESGAFDDLAPVEAFVPEPVFARELAEAELVEPPVEIAEPVTFDNLASAEAFVAEPPVEVDNVDAHEEVAEAELVDAPVEVAEAEFVDAPMEVVHADLVDTPVEIAADEFVDAPVEIVEPTWEPVEAFDEPEIEEAMVFSGEAPPEFAEFAASPILTSNWMAEAITSMGEASEPIGQGQPIPYLVPASADAPVEQVTEPEAEMLPADFAKAAALAGFGALSQSLDKPSFAAQDVSPEPTAQQSTQPDTMQSTPTTPVPTIRTGPATPMTGGAPQMQPAGMQSIAPQPGGMHTAVQLTFSFEITSLQLTPNFKMGAVQLKPTSKIVTMRLAPSQHPQPAMNLQITFEVASVQLNGNSIGMIRLTPSQQQRPSITNSSSFNIAGLQLVSGSEAAPVQMTPSQQGQASVHVTAGFQIATVEFSPSFEIASIILNATSKNASVQLPGTGPSALEGAPVFEIANVQLGGNGEITGMQLNPRGAALKNA